MDGIRRSSIWFQIAFFLPLQYQRERWLGKGLLTLPCVFLHSSPKGEVQPPPSQVSHCQVFWRLLFAPITIPAACIAALILGFGVVLGGALALTFIGVVIFEGAKDIGSSIGSGATQAAHTVAVHWLGMAEVVAVIAMLVAILFVLKTKASRELAEITAGRYKAWKENHCPIIPVID